MTVEGSTSVRVTWGRVTNPLATNYTIEYRPVGDNGAYMNRTVLEDGSASYSETIGGGLTIQPSCDGFLSEHQEVVEGGD